MNCKQTGTHTVKAGDSLYKIAQMHQMTVPELMNLNPGADPYNLQIGDSVIICNDGHGADHGGAMPPVLDFGKTTLLSNQMRLAWERHIYWDRMLMISITAGLRDEDAVTARLMRNPGEITSVFAPYYPDGAMERLEQLLAEHLNIGKSLITAWSMGDMEQANEWNRRWYANADQIVEELNSLNPYFKTEDLQRMLGQHLELAKQQTAQRLAGNYAADIQAFDQEEQGILAMADYLAFGIVKQFPRLFPF